jgi:hypothetical protein
MIAFDWYLRIFFVFVANSCYLLIVLISVSLVTLIALFSLVSLFSFLKLKLLSLANRMQNTISFQKSLLLTRCIQNTVSCERRKNLKSTLDPADS